jgi:putative ABC transport system permease protein
MEQPKEVAGGRRAHPLISALLRNWLGPSLVALQIATALAVLVNAAYVVKQRVDRIGRPTGMDVANIFAVRSLGFTENYLHAATIRLDLDYLRSIPGVIAATSIDYVPLSGNGNTMGVMLQPNDQAHAVGSGYYEVDEQAVAALGVHLVAGRVFREDEVLPARVGEAASIAATGVIVTQAIANDLYPKGDALGKTLYDSFGWLGSPATIIGIVEQMHGGRVASPRVDRVVLVPRLPYPDEPAANYIVRTKPGQRDAIMGQAAEHMETSNPDRVIEWIRPLDFFRNRSYITDRNMSVFLVVVTALLLAIGAVGIFGLAKFNVSARTRQIGIRRALGARKIDIVSHFLIENLLVATTGIVLGCALALGAGYWLALRYQLPRLDLYYLVAGIPVVWLVALLAAWHPARRAAAVSPAVATRGGDAGLQ